MITYDLAKMLAEIRRDEQGGTQAPKVLSQEEIRAMARKRRGKPAAGGAKKP
jgi:hypothetical protein